MIDEYSEKRIEEFYKEYQKLTRFEKVEVLQKIWNEEFAGEELTIRDRHIHDKHEFEACVDELD